MAILQCNKCANLFHDDAPHECDVERWQRLAREAQQAAYGGAIGNAPKPAAKPIFTPEGMDKAIMELYVQSASSPLDRALEDFIARRKAKREDGLAAFDNSGPHWACEHCGLLVKANDAAYSAHESACDARIVTRAMSTPLPHDPPMSARLMPWRGK